MRLFVGVLSRPDESVRLVGLRLLRHFVPLLDRAPGTGSGEHLSQTLPMP